MTDLMTDIQEKINEANQLEKAKTLIDDANKKQMNTYKKTQAKEHARKILLSNLNGALATITRINRPLGGFPMGSVVPYMIDEHGDIIILISEIAEHTKNLNAEPKASLLIYNNEANNVQQSWRLTAIGNVLPITDHDEIMRVSERYYRFYPSAVNYHNTHNFHFYKLSPLKYRIIMDFGKIAWVDNDDFITSTPFSHEHEMAMINHMNHDHTKNMYHYLECLGVETQKHKKIEMININQYGCHIRHDGKTHFIDFDERCHDPIAVRHALIRLAKKELPLPIKSN